jgi:DNA-binding CsgD family transcriptional regulator
MRIDAIHRELSELLFTLYHSNTHGEGKRCFLTRLAGLMTAQRASLIVIPPTTTGKGLIYTSGKDEDTVLAQDIIQSYGQYYTQDPLVNLPLGQPVTIDDIVSREAFSTNEYYRLFLEPIGVHFVVGLDWRTAQGARCSLRLTRRKEQGNFDREDKGLLTMLLPHLEQSLSLGIRLQLQDCEKHIYSSTVARRAIGIITLNSCRRILKTNSTAERYLAEEGSGMQRLQHRLRLDDVNRDAIFQDYVYEALDAAQQGATTYVNALSLSSTEQRTGYQLVIKPLPVNRDHESEVTPYIAIYIQNPDKDLDISIRTLMKLYQLTPSEASVATLLAAGHTSEEVAGELSVKKNTVRAHIRSIFVKTGVSRQSMLVAQILKSLATT